MVNHNGPNCGFSTELVSYLYNELSTNEKNRFESHLNNCAVCVAEIAAFGTVRGAIAEWKSSVDLSRLPAIKVPEPHTTTSVGPTFLESLKAWLGGFPAMAAGAAALVILALGAAFLLVPGSDSDEIAGANTNPSKAVISPTAQPSIGTTSPQTVPTVSPNPEGPKTAGPQIVKATENKPVPKAGSRRPVVPQNSKKSTQRQTPVILDDEDDEDTSIRLADLFDEIGTELKK